MILQIMQKSEGIQRMSARFKLIDLDHDFIPIWMEKERRERRNNLFVSVARKKKKEKRSIGKLRSIVGKISVLLNFSRSNNIFRVLER